MVGGGRGGRLHDGRTKGIYNKNDKSQIDRILYSSTPVEDRINYDIETTDLLTDRVSLVRTLLY